MVWYSHLFQNFPQFIVIHTVKGSGVVNKAEIDVSPLVNTMALGLPVSPGTGLIINTCYRDAYGASLVAQMVKNLSAMQEIWVQPLGWGDPLEEGMATHSSILAWRIPWTEEPGGLQSVGLQRFSHD